MTKFHSILLIVLSSTGGCLFAFPSATVPYALGVLLDLTVGVILAGVVVHERWPLLRQRSLRARFDWGMLAAELLQKR